MSVLRLGHRPGRDPRLTTHVILTARAFGARQLFLEPPDAELVRRVDALRDGWGGDFDLVGVADWRKVVREFEGTVVHLTMYGLPFERVLPRLRRSRRLLLVVGGAKVPRGVYELASYNVAVGHQPHSEVAALAVVLERLKGIPGPGAWSRARRVIVPRARGKKVKELPLPKEAE